MCQCTNKYAVYNLYYNRYTICGSGYSYCYGYCCN